MWGVFLFLLNQEILLLNCIFLDKKHYCWNDFWIRNIVVGMIFVLGKCCGVIVFLKLENAFVDMSWSIKWKGCKWFGRDVSDLSCFAQFRPTDRIKLRVMKRFWVIYSSYVICMPSILWIMGKENVFSGIYAQTSKDIGVLELFWANMDVI